MNVIRVFLKKWIFPDLENLNLILVNLINDVDKLEEEIERLKESHNNLSEKIKKSPHQTKKIISPKKEKKKKKK